MSTTDSDRNCAYRLSDKKWLQENSEAYQAIKLASRVQLTEVKPISCIARWYNTEQGWYSGENARRPPMWPRFDSSLVSYVG